MIKEFTGGDLFKIDPLIEYDKDYYKCIEEAKVDLKNNSRPKLKRYLEDIDDYDIVYLGYPNYWGNYDYGCVYIFRKI